VFTVDFFKKFDDDLANSDTIAVVDIMLAMHAYANTVAVVFAQQRNRLSVHCTVLMSTIHRRTAWRPLAKGSGPGF